MRRIDVEPWLGPGVCVFAIVIGIVGLERPMFIDEAYSVLTSSGSLREILAHLRRDNNLPLYFVLLHWWMAWFGISEIAIRVPSVLLYGAGILVTRQLALETTGDRRVALYSAWAYAVSLQAIHLAQKARPYSLLGLCAAASVLFFFRAFWRETPRRRDAWIYVAATAAGTFTHAWFVFVLGAEAVAGLVGLRRRRLALFSAAAVAALVPFAALWGPSLLEQLGNGASDWIAPLDLRSAIGAIPEFYGGWGIGGLLLACGAGLAVAGRRRRRPFDSQIAAVLMIAAGSLALPLLMSLVKPVYWPGRYTIISLPALAVLSAWALSGVRPVPLATFASGVLLLVLGLHVRARRDLVENSGAVLTDLQSDRHAVEVVAPLLAPGDAVIFTGLSRPSVEYYLRRSKRDRDLELISYPAVNGEHLGWDETRLTQAALDADASRLVTDLHNRSIGRAWVFVGTNARANGALSTALLAGGFSPAGTVDARGAFFSSVARVDARR